MPRPELDKRGSRLGSRLSGLGRGLILILWVWVAARLLLGAAGDGGEASLALMAAPCLACLGLLMAPGVAPQSDEAQPETIPRRRPPRIVADLRQTRLLHRTVLGAPHILLADGLAGTTAGRRYPRRPSRIVCAAAAKDEDLTAPSA